MPEGFSTDSYPKAALPVQKSPIEIAGQLGALQSQKLGIDQQKLDQANQGFTYLTRAMTSLGPNASKDEYKAVGANAVKMGLVPPNMLNIWDERVDAAPDSPTFFKQALGAVADHQQQLNLQTGAPATATDNANIYQGKTDVMTGGFTPATQAPIQPPPTQPNINNQPTIPDPNNPNGPPIRNPKYLQPGIIGAPPAGVRPVRQGLPVQQPSQTAPAPVSALPSRLPVATTGATGPTTQTGFDFKQRFAGDTQGMATGAAPGVVEAEKTVGEQSGKDYATALQRAGNIQADLQPDLAVLNIVKGKAAGDFGPGTESLNQLKKLAVTWLPDVDPKIINSSSDYDTVKKYLVQGARSAGNTGTNDQLAAAFDASPNVTMNTATIESIVKSRVALKKMEAAQALIANQQGIASDQFSRWKAQNQNTLDPRAFGFDLMDGNARSKLMNNFGKIDKGSGEWVAKDKEHQKEFNKFEQSLSFANDAGLIEPPGRK